VKSWALLPLLAPGLAMALVMALALAPAWSGALAFTPEERARIEAHGPWPPAPVRDTSNRVHGQPQAIALGRRLFFDKRLSASGRLACASCHNPQQAFQDGRRFTRHNRNTPSLINSSGQRWFGWDGAHDSLWSASVAPLTAGDEMAATPQRVVALLKGDATLKRHYTRLFGAPQADATVIVNSAKALAAYLATLVSPRTPFDDFRDALGHGDTSAAARYPEAAQRGLKLFVGEGRCFFCHTGPAFTNGEFADIGRPFFTPAGADPGRWGGLRLLLASPHNRLGGFSDAAPDDAQATATHHVVTEPRHFGEFKVPGLRGLPTTAPYFHNGSAATIEDVLRSYSELDESRLHADGERLLRALRLTQQQVADLAAFLRTLGGPARPQPRQPLPSKP
jgi:cytochrome c peroxidase